MNAFNIRKSFEEKKRKGWDTLYWLIDLHDTIIEGKYNRFNHGANFYPGAIEVLNKLSRRPDIVLILWTSSHYDSIINILDRLKEQGVEFKYINANPECFNTELCDFTQKPYFNVILDDKGGFEGNTDWLLIKKELEEIKEW